MLMNTKYQHCTAICTVCTCWKPIFVFDIRLLGARKLKKNRIPSRRMRMRMTAELRRGRQRDNSVSQNPSLLQFSKENLMCQCIRVRGQAVGNRTCDLCSVYFTLGPVESSCSAIPPPLFDGHIRGRETRKSRAYGAAYMGTRWYFIIASTASHGAPIFVVKKAIHLPVSLMVLRGYSEDT
jgi:hypothetical protein